MSRACVACFVKTPGLSPIKTRLAASASPELAAEFYRRACDAMASVLCAAAGAGDDFAVRWAVAETAGAAYWPRIASDAAATRAPSSAAALPGSAACSVLAQGDGALGDRLDAVYRAALAIAPAALLIGADTPQLTVDLLRQALAALAHADFVLGPAADGGFYLFAGRTPIPATTWTSVTYSGADTARDLAAALAAHGRVAWLAPTLADADEAADLARVAAELAALRDPTAAQRDLALWLAALPQSAISPKSAASTAQV